MWHPTGPRTASAWACSTSPTATATSESGPAWSRPNLPRAYAARRHRLSRTRRPSPARSGLDGLLADDLALASAGHADAQCTGKPAPDLPVRHLADQPPVAIEQRRPDRARCRFRALLRPARTSRRICHDAVTGETVVEHPDDAGAQAHSTATAWSIRHRRPRNLTASRRYDPLSAWTRDRLDDRDRPRRLARAHAEQPQRHARRCERPSIEMPSSSPSRTTRRSSAAAGRRSIPRDHV
jgi:hypothetical protein